jgi:hypothetical protein
MDFLTRFSEGTAARFEQHEVEYSVGPESYLEFRALLKGTTLRAICHYYFTVRSDQEALISAAIHRLNLLAQMHHALKDAAK